MRRAEPQAGVTSTPAHAGRSEPALSSRRIALWLALLVGAVCIQRLRTYDEPFDRDITTYAVIGHELLHGARLYADVFDHKPPAVYLTFAAAERLVGYGEPAVYAINVAFTALGLLGVSLAAARRGASLALIGGLIWLLYAYDVDLEANQPNVELCLNALLACAFACLAWGDRLGPAAWWLAGSFVAAGTLYKHVAIAVLPLWLAAALIRDGRQLRAWRDVAARVAGLLLPTILAWVAVLAWFWFEGRLKSFVAAVVVFNRDYVGSPATTLAALLAPRKVWPRVLVSQLPLLALTGLGLVRTLVRRPRESGPLLAFLLGATLMVALPGQFFTHYYQLYLPALVLGATDWFHDAAWMGRWRALTLLGVVALGLAIHLGQLRLDGEAASRRKFGPDFVTVRAVSRRVDSLVGRDEAVYVYGIDTGIYFHGRRRPMTRVLWINHLRGSLAGVLRASLRRELTSRPPRLIVRDTRYTTRWIPSSLADWIDANYVPLPPAPELAPFRLLVPAAPDARVEIPVSRNVLSPALDTRRPFPQNPPE
jgi:hypothetical protein